MKRTKAGPGIIKRTVGAATRLFSPTASYQHEAAQRRVVHDAADAAAHAARKVRGPQDGSEKTSMIGKGRAAGPIADRMTRTPVVEANVRAIKSSKATKPVKPDPMNPPLGTSPAAVRQIQGMERERLRSKAGGMNPPSPPDPGKAAEKAAVSNMSKVSVGDTGGSGGGGLGATGGGGGYKRVGKGSSRGGQFTK